MEERRTGGHNFRMSIGYELNFSGVGDVQKRLAMFGPSPGLSRVIGEAARDTAKEHLFRLDESHANKMGGKRSHFYWEAGKNTVYEPTADGADVVMTKTGLRQRWLGGTITAKNVKFLTIPARSESYGVPAREFPGTLKFIPTQRGGMLVKENPAPSYETFTDASGQAHRKYGKQKRLRTAGLVEYWLVPSVYQSPDPSVIPSPEKIGNAVGTAASEYLMGHNL